MISNVASRRIRHPAAHLGPLAAALERIAQPDWGGLRLRYGAQTTAPAGGVTLDDAPAASGPFARSRVAAQIEAILFAAKEPVTARKLAQAIGLADASAARTLLRELGRLYDASGSALQLAEAAGGFQLRTRAEYARWLRRFAGASGPGLSQPAAETLAVTAYLQPIERAEIEAIRGVQCGEMLRQLMERGLVRIVGRSTVLGRPYLYGTTRAFLEAYGLRRIEDLPPGPSRESGELPQNVAGFVEEPTVE